MSGGVSLWCARAGLEKQEVALDEAHAHGLHALVKQVSTLSCLFTLKQWLCVGAWLFSLNPTFPQWNFTDQLWHCSLGLCLHIKLIAQIKVWTRSAEIPGQVIHASGFGRLALITAFAFHLGFAKPGRSGVDAEIIVRHVRGFQTEASNPPACCGT